MDDATAKKFVEENIRYDQVKALLVKLLRFPSPQTELLEAEPQVRALIREVIRFELEEAGVIMTSSLSQKSTTRPKSSPSWHCTGDGLGNDLITPPPRCHGGRPLERQSRRSSITPCQVVIDRAHDHD